MKINTVIFDLDGTLLDTLGGLYESVNFSLRQLNYPEKTFEQVKNSVGDGVAKLIERVLPYGRQNGDFEKCLDIFKNHYSQIMRTNTKIYPDIISVLTKLKKNGYKIVVVSNKFDKAVKSLCKDFFGDLVDFAYGENEAAGIRKKPAPDIIFEIFKNLNITCEQAVFVGDSQVDIQTAKNAQIPCISVSWGYKSKEFLLENGAEVIIDKPEQIFSYV